MGDGGPSPYTSRGRGAICVIGGRQSIEQVKSVGLTSLGMMTDKGLVPGCWWS